MSPTNKPDTISEERLREMLAGLDKLNHWLINTRLVGHELTALDHANTVLAARDALAARSGGVVSDEHVERAARAMHGNAPPVMGGGIGWDVLAGDWRIVYRELARTCLSTIEPVTTEDFDGEPCATEGCGKRPASYYEAGGIGSYYCKDCLNKINTLSRPDPVPPAEGAPMGVAERLRDALNSHPGPYNLTQAQMYANMVWREALASPSVEQGVTDEQVERAAKAIAAAALTAALSHIKGAGE